ncbi:hypothetical protein EDB85DRAFT_1032752 [Lactarius pseudohatsudake]|nr:hypothetical protein EDB85DRAFT_1032752 [Lactarius pseudohatsudake]
MTATPRSSLPWRTSRKNRAPTSLSLIVAEPEAASPLASAVTLLQPINMPSDSDVKTASVTVEDPETQATTETQPPLTDNGEPQPVFSSSPTGDATGLPAPDANVAKPSEALVPTPAPQPRSWLASLSRRGSSNTPLNELAKQTPTGERPTTPEPSPSTVAVAPPPADLPEPNPAPATSPVSDPQVASHAAQPEADIKSVPSKRQWFGSSSSSKRPSKLRPMDKPESAITHSNRFSGSRNSTTPCHKRHPSDSPETRAY